MGRYALPVDTISIVREFPCLLVVSTLLYRHLTVTLLDRAGNGRNDYPYTK